MPNRTWKATNATIIEGRDINVDFEKNGSIWFGNITWLPSLGKHIRRLSVYLLLITFSDVGLVRREDGKTARTENLVASETTTS